MTIFYFVFLFIYKNHLKNIYNSCPPSHSRLYPSPMLSKHNSYILLCTREPNQCFGGSRFKWGGSRGWGVQGGMAWMVGIWLLWLQAERVMPPSPPCPPHLPTQPAQPIILRPFPVHTHTPLPIHVHIRRSHLLPPFLSITPPRPALNTTTSYSSHKTWKQQNIFFSEKSIFV